MKVDLYGQIPRDNPHAENNWRFNLFYIHKYSDIKMRNVNVQPLLRVQTRKSDLFVNQK